MNRKVKRLIAVLAVIAMAAMCIPAMANVDDVDTKAVVGTNLSDFSTTDVYGEPYDGSIFGEYELTILNMWATWCGPCITELPHLQSLYENYQDRGVNVMGLLAIDSTSTVQAAITMMENKGLTYPTLIPDDTLLGIMDQCMYIPDTFVVDKEGNVLEWVVGGMSYQQFVNLVEKWLPGEEPTPTPVQPTATPVQPTATPVQPTATPDQPTPPPQSGDLIFGEYFEENPTDWALVDADGDGHDWYWFTNEGLTTGLMEAYEGMGIMVSASYDNPSFSALTPDNYLISPDIAIPANAAEAYLSWYAAAQDPAWFSEHYSVLVGPAGSTNPADFTDVIHTETLSSASWVNRTADLTDYAGETVRIAFRHHDATDMFVMKLDQVEVFAEAGEVPTPTPEQPTPTPGECTSPTPEQPEDPTPTLELPTPTPGQPAETTPKPQDPPKAGGVSLAIVGAAVAALGAAGIITRRKRS